MSLDRSILASPIPPDTQAEIASRFWGPASFQFDDRQPYFQYYTEQCRIVFQSHKSRLPLKTHQDIVDIATEILADLSRSEVQLTLVEKYSASGGNLDDAVNACIDLTVRLVFMLDAGEFPNTFSGRRKLVWSSDSIQDFMQKTFPKQQNLSHDGLKLGRDFNVSNMVRIAGMNVELTTNLADHLRLRDADKTVTIYHHASFLKSQRQYVRPRPLPSAHRSMLTYHALSSSLLFPKGLIEETLSTLSLLFPQGNRACEKWYIKQEQFDDLDHVVLKCASAKRRIDEYKYWHDRLVALKEEFDEARPSTLSQWWNDRREGTQWYTLWVAISLTLLFGLIQSIVGAMQLYRAYHP